MSNDFDFEPVRGLPAELPQGERMIWQGGPEWREVARRVLHVDKLAAYLAVVVAWRMVGTVRAGGGFTDTVASAGWLTFASIAVLAILVAIAWAMARTTVYTITSKRVIMRIGVALPVTFNVPFKAIRGADLGVRSDGSGDIALKLDPETRLAYFVLWPHARPWQFSHPQPSMRCVKNAPAVGEQLGAALAEHVQTSARLAGQSTAPAPRAGAQPSSREKDDRIGDVLAARPHLTPAE